jgi:hypothetical protein
MKASGAVLVGLAIAAGRAAAQPGTTEPSQGPPLAPSGPGPYAPPPYAYQPQVPLTAEEQDLLATGEISDGQHIGGGVAALLIGFGAGQAVQGRWHDTGWIFTLAEPIATTVAMVGLVDAFSDTCWVPGPCDKHISHRDVELIWGGLIALGGLHLWEVVDAFSVPPQHNARVRALRARLGYPAGMYTHLTP